MTTTAERIRTTISVDPEVHEIFKRMAAASGMSVSRCMGEWLADTADGAQLIAMKMEEARRAPMAVMREMQAMMIGQTELVESTIREIRDKARQGSAKERGRVSGTSDAVPPAVPSGKRRVGVVPPSSNTGVEVPHRTSRSPGKP